MSIKSTLPRLLPTNLYLELKAGNGAKHNLKRINVNIKHIALSLNELVQNGTLSEIL